MIPYEEIQLLTSIKGEESQAGEAGASGKVVKGLWKGKVVAVKLMHFQNVENFEPGWRKGIQDVNESKKREIEKEAENYSKLNHPNIIKFYGLTRVGNCVHIVIEYVEGGSLQELIDRTVKKVELLDAVKKIQIALDVAVGVNYLHVDQEMVHRDLKPQNILICEGYRAKLCDFGSARNVVNVTLQNIGTMLFAAPEVFKETEKKMGSYAADVYSFGVVFWCLFFETGPPGMRETMPPKTIPRVACEKKTGEAVLALVKECCEVQPERRTGMKEVVEKLEILLEELKRKDHKKVVNEIALLKSKFGQREAALNSRIVEYQKLLKTKEDANRKLGQGLMEKEKLLKTKEDANRKLGQGLSEKENVIKSLEESLKQAQKEAANKDMEKRQLARGLSEKENIIKRLEESLKQAQKEAENKDMEINRLKRELERAVKAVKVREESNVKTTKRKDMIVKQREMEMESSFSVPRGFKSQRGILVPQNVVFEVNEMWRSSLEKMFSNGNKVAKGTYNYVCFKTSTVFTAGKMFYFQVSANVGNGCYMGFGILSGEVTTHYVGYHEKGWAYNCEPGVKSTFHNKKESSGYGPKRNLGKHKFGIFCDFTNGKGEVSFIVDGKNWGVAYKNVKPPVSPAFYIWSKMDSFKIEDRMEVPDCLRETA